MERLNRLVERWGNLAALALGAVVLFVGLGKSGLWEPWEMERADLARTLASPPEAVLVLGPGADGTAEVVARAAREVGVVIRKPDAAAGGEGAAALGAALDLARTRVVASVVIDLQLLFPSSAGGVAGGSDTAWATAAQRISEAVAYTSGGTVVLVHRDTTPGATELRQRLALERWRALWDGAAVTWQLDGLADHATVEQALARLAAAEPDDQSIHIVAPTDSQGLERARRGRGRRRGARGVQGSWPDRGGAAARDVAARRGLPRARHDRARDAAARVAARVHDVVDPATTLRTLWGARVALMAGVVLATIPFLCAGAGRGGRRGLRPVVDAGRVRQLLAARVDVPRLVPWAYLAAGLVVGVLTKGLFAGLTISALSLAAPLVMGSRSLREWQPAVAAAAVTGVLALLVLGAAPGSFFAQLGLAVPRFD